MMRKILANVFFIYFLGMTKSFALSTEQPLAEPAFDLRGRQIVFSIESLENHESFLLEKTSNGDYLLRRKDKAQEQLLKLAGRLANRIDKEFSANFLSLQYEISDSPGKCKITLRLNLRGEAQDVCQKDDQKTRKIKAFIDAELSPRF